MGKIMSMVWIMMLLAVMVIEVRSVVTIASAHHQRQNVQLVVQNVTSPHQLQRESGTVAWFRKYTSLYIKYTFTLFSFIHIRKYVKEKPPRVPFTYTYELCVSMDRYLLPGTQAVLCPIRRAPGAETTSFAQPILHLLPSDTRNRFNIFKLSIN
ncbi:hypothetical protein IGI04_006775 [Brassica rapa subsp. trilocularis]|uniref:Secreted protein n=1 Tax=Brassica rapa subsp. trilocularis TaxID=1813537 RepID=A0ABQ7NJ59_BRACM|nr:hypothetical protein IGI04_006775 [Brassica rapa subsp. trilocularis]